MLAEEIGWYLETGFGLLCVAIGLYILWRGPRYAKENGCPGDRPNRDSKPFQIRLSDGGDEGDESSDDDNRPSQCDTG